MSVANGSFLPLNTPQNRTVRHPRLTKACVQSGPMSRMFHSKRVSRIGCRQLALAS